MRASALHVADCSCLFFLTFEYRDHVLVVNFTAISMCVSLCTPCSNIDLMCCILCAVVYYADLVSLHAPVTFNIVYHWEAHGPRYLFSSCFNMLHNQVLFGRRGSLCHIVILLHILTYYVYIKHNSCCYQDHFEL